MLAQIKLGQLATATVGHADGSTLMELWIRDDGGDLVLLKAAEAEQLRRALNHWHESGLDRVQEVADADLKANPVTPGEWEDARLAEEDVKLAYRVGSILGLTAAGRVYVHDTRTGERG